MIGSWKNKAAIAMMLTALCISFRPEAANAARKSCADQIKEALIALSPATQGTLITEKEKEQIQSIFEDPQKRSTAASYVFDLLMEKRLALLPPKDAEQIKSVIQSAKLNESSGVDGAYSFRFRSIDISLPKSYHGSMVEFFIKTHEVEHAIQDRMEAGKLGKESFGYFRRLLNQLNSQTRFLEEAGAMQAEWQYLQALPSRAKQEMADDVLQNPQLSENEKDFLIRIFAGDAWTASDHTEIEWRAGRYSLSEIERQVRFEKLGFSTIAVGVTSVTHLAAFTMIESICENTIKKSTTLPTGPFYEKVCTRQSNVQKLQAEKYPASLTRQSRSPAKN
ncbi:MAG: hypothetical protein ACJ763_20270 [Bdellovibrionia bacterium]